MNLHLASILFLLVLSAFFSASETAFTSLSFIQIRELETGKRTGGKIAAKLAAKHDLLLTTILIGNNIVNLTASALTTTYAIAVWGSNTIGYATGMLTFVLLIFGEITPKQLAMAHNTAIASFFAGPLKLLTIIMYPLILVAKGFSSIVTRLFSKKQKESLSMESLLHVVDVAETEGIVDEYETSLVQRVLHFSEATVKTIMTHRTEVFSVFADQTLSEAFPNIVSSGFSRIPVYQQSPEDITGILLLRDVLSAVVEHRMDEMVSRFAIEPIFVPETRKVDDMFFQFKQEKQHLAIVLDEYGGLSGIVSMEDIVEQLFGEIYDEHETGEAERIRKDDSGYMILADTSLQQVKDELDLEMELGDSPGTVAGYIYEQLGAIPVSGDVVATPVGTFVIISMKGNRIESVRLENKSQTQET